MLDTAGYGPLNITKSLAVTVPPGVDGFVTVTSGNGITIATGSEDVVSLRGLIIEGNNNSIGINVSSIGTLTVENCTMRSLNYGIIMRNPANGRLVATGCSVRDVFYGIYLATAVSGIKVAGVVTGCAVDNARGGAIYAGNFFSNTTVNLTVRDFVLTGNDSGLRASGPGTTITADNCAVNRT